MLHSYVKVYIHYVWSTKNREPFLICEVRPNVRQHIIDYAQTRDITIDSIEIQKDHVHILIYLKSNQNIDEIAKLLKGESSHWVNSENLIKPKFSWQRGYGAFSISASHLDAVRLYIKNQNEHHRHKTYTEELQNILRKYGISISELGESE